MGIIATKSSGFQTFSSDFEPYSYYPSTRQSPRISIRIPVLVFGKGIPCSGYVDYLGSYCDEQIGPKTGYDHSSPVSEPTSGTNNSQFESLLPSLKLT